MRDAAARNFALEQGKTFYRSTKGIVLEFAQNRTGNHQVKGRCGKMDAAPAADRMVDDVMRRWPSTIRVFPDFRMRCVRSGHFHL